MPQQQYLNHPMQQLDHALPMSYRSPEDNQDRMLSVSGKKKCSYCGNELGKKNHMKKTVFYLFIIAFEMIAYRTWGGNDYRKSVSFLPYGVFQMLRVSRATR